MNNNIDISKEHENIHRVFINKNKSLLKIYKDTINKYSGSEYKFINNYMRGFNHSITSYICNCSLKDLTDYKTLQYCNKHNQKRKCTFIDLTNKLKDFFKLYKVLPKTTEEIIVSRKTDFDEINKLKLKNKDLIFYSSFISTSYDDSLMKKNQSWKHLKYKVNIIIPKGSKIIIPYNSNAKSENEIILPPSYFKFVNKNTIKIEKQLINYKLWNKNIKDLGIRLVEKSIIKKQKNKKRLVKKSIIKKQKNQKQKYYSN